uniref:NADH-ubiquinone oxidoreductase chain 3 n=1 Tax=Conchocele cf. bisecta HPD1644 TaxID=1872713 RepID=A0A1B4WRJ7_9BIVA|nr:NADH dehydrogenase subunit 3 [Conchocele cf. bisecta HPD1644]
MFTTGVSIIVSAIVSLTMMLISSLISWKNTLDREKLSTYECGFDPFMSSRSPFSLRFFLLAVIFLVFDVELVFLFPYVSSIINSFNMSSLMLEILFLFILGWGLFHEWMEGSLEWKN